MRRRKGGREKRGYRKRELEKDRVVWVECL